MKHVRPLARAGLAMAALFTIFHFTARSYAMPDEGLIATKDENQLYYERRGTGEKVIIAPAHMWLTPWIMGLGDDYTVIAYDMRNRGRSSYVEDAGTLSINQDVADLEAVRAHFGINSFTPVGWSYLGLMVVLYAQQYPEHVDRIVQIGPMAMKFGTAYPPELTANDPEPIVSGESQARLAALRAENYHIDQPQEYCSQAFEITKRQMVGGASQTRLLDDLGRRACASELEGATNLARHFGALFPSFQAVAFGPAEAAEIVHPVLTIHGTRDRNAPYGGGREWVYHLLNARLVTVEGTAHMVIAEETERVLGAVRVFLEGGWPAEAETVDDPVPTVD